MALQWCNRFFSFFLSGFHNEANGEVTSRPKDGKYGESSERETENFGRRKIVKHTRTTPLTPDDGDRVERTAGIERRPM